LRGGTNCMGFPESSLHWAITDRSPSESAMLRRPVFGKPALRR
jgi:hypothetical protein